MFHSLRQMLAVFSRAERFRFIGVFAAMIGMGFLQMAGIGVVLPFVSLMSDVGAIHNNALLEALYNALDFESTNSFLILLGSVLLLVLVGSNIITALTLWLMTHFAWGVQRRVSSRLLAGYLAQPYEAFLNRNSAETGKNILVESQQFANGVLIPAMKSLAFGITASMIIGFLFWVNPLIALVVTFVFGGAYLLVYLTIRRVLLRIGRERMEANTDRFQAVDEAFGSVKEVKVLGREAYFLERYKPAASVFATAMAKSQVLAQIPRYVIEGLAFGIVMLGVIFVLASGKSVESALPVASAFVVAGYRLLPALQNLYQGFTQWRFNHSVVETLHSDLTNLDNAGAAREEVSSRASKGAQLGSSATKLPFEAAFELNQVYYSYPGANEPSLRNVSLAIPKNSFVALTGSTGAGKTTLADIILGLLEPSAGNITVDGIELTSENRACWQANIGYVPQEIYLTDGSVAGNIAYGVADDAIVLTSVERAARIANIHDFIINRLPKGYQTPVGERGVRLSGGQRQRIGIARALYHNPSVIVLDEATSALDNDTEQRIVNELDAMRGGRTLIVIAHRLSTVQKCHKVFMLDEGRLAAEGTYDEVVLGNQRQANES